MVKTRSYPSALTVGHMTKPRRRQHRTIKRTEKWVFDKSKTFMLPPKNRCPFCGADVWFAVTGPETSQIVEPTKSVDSRDNWALLYDPATQRVKANKGGQHETHRCKERIAWAKTHR